MPAEMKLEKLIEEHGDSIFRMCYLYLKDYHLAEDAVQETFIKAMKNYDSFKGQSNERTWLIRIAINTCKNMMRMRWFIGTSGEEQEESIGDFTGEIVEKATVSKAIMRLPEKDREVIILYYYQELKVREIAGLIGKSENVVLQRLRRARGKLKLILKKEGYDYNETTDR